MRSIGKLIMVSLTGVVFTINVAKAQFEPINGYSEGALLFSQTQWNGSARILGIGGTQTALGGDISSISGNPAGLGFYNHSELSFSPSLNFITAQSDYLGSSNSSSIAHFSIGNLGVVINKSRPAKEGNPFLGGSFGFSYNRINDFNYEAYYAGNNDTNDFIDYVIGKVDANKGVDDNDYVQSLSFQNYLINDYNPDSSGFWPDASYIEPADVGNPLQTEKITSKGSQDQWSFSYGANISDRFYFGLSLGIISLNYKTTRQYSEIRYPQSILDNFVLNESLLINGTGVNGTFGAIVRPIDVLTLGISYTLPTVYQINDEFNAYMISTWRNSALDYYPNDPNFTGDQSASIDPIVSNYTMRTAPHLNAGAAIFLNKNGFISGDVEWVNYTNAKFSGGGIDFQTDNDNIDQMAKSALNYRIGGEYRINDYRLRAGYNHTGDFYNHVDNLDRSKNAFSGGAGYRGKSFYSDLTAMYTFYNSSTSPYELDPKPVADFDNSRLGFILTLGFLF